MQEKNNKHQKHKTNKTDKNTKQTTQTRTKTKTSTAGGQLISFTGNWQIRGENK